MYINVCLNIVIKKDNFDIYLFYISIYNRRKRENRFIIYKLYYRRESVIIIIIFLLFEFSNHSMCLIMNDFLREISLHDINSTIFQNMKL